MNTSRWGGKFIFLGAIVALSAGPAFGTVSYICDPSINATVSGLCTALNATVAGFYNSTFTNANASIYIQIANNGGLGESTTGYLNLVPYSTYQSTLETESTDSAKSTLPGAEPGLYGGSNVNLTSALEDAMGIGGATGTQYDSGGNASTGWRGAACGKPGDGATSTSCYNGIITIQTPAGLLSETGGAQGYFYPGLQAGNPALSNYDFFSIVEHETDEVLGTSSCVNLPSSGIPTNGCGSSTTPSAIDLFRYTSAGTRVLSTFGTTQYFSADGGVTDYEGNTYNTTAVNNDWGDFSSGCTFVQDKTGCPNGEQFNISTDGPGGITGPEIAMLNAVGYDLQSQIPEPATIGLIGASLIGLGLVSRSRRKK